MYLFLPVKWVKCKEIAIKGKGQVGQAGQTPPKSVFLKHTTYELN